MDAQPRVWLVEGNSSLSVQLTGLGRYVLYEVQVLAFTRIGDGSPSHPPILERTLDDGELPPLQAWEPPRLLPSPTPRGVTLCSCERLVAEGHQPRCEGMLIADCAPLREKGPLGGSLTSDSCSLSGSSIQNRDFASGLMSSSPGAGSPLSQGLCEAEAWLFLGMSLLVLFAKQ